MYDKDGRIAAFFGGAISAVLVVFLIIAFAKAAGIVDPSYDGQNWTIGFADRESVIVYADECRLWSVGITECFLNNERVGTWTDVISAVVETEETGK